MGMAAHQSRFLALTSRQNSIGLQLTRLSAEKMSLARDMQKVSKNYNEALTKKVLTWSNNSGINYSTLSYKTFMAPNSLNGATPYFLSDKDGRIVLDSKYAAYAKRISPDGSPQSGSWKNSPERNNILKELVGFSDSEWSFANYKAEGHVLSKADNGYNEGNASAGTTTFNAWMVSKGLSAENASILDYYEYSSEQAVEYNNMLQYYQGISDYYSVMLEGASKVSSSTCVSAIVNKVLNTKGTDGKKILTQSNIDNGAYERAILGENILNSTEIAAEYQKMDFSNYNNNILNADILQFISLKIVGNKNFVVTSQSGYDDAYKQFQKIFKGQAYQQYVNSEDVNTLAKLYAAAASVAGGAFVYQDDAIKEVLTAVDKGVRAFAANCGSYEKSLLEKYIPTKDNLSGYLSGAKNNGSENIITNIVNNVITQAYNEAKAAGKLNLLTKLQGDFNKDQKDQGVPCSYSQLFARKESAEAQLIAGSGTSTTYDKLQTALDNKNTIFSADQLQQIEFYDKIFESIFSNGWVENNMVNDQDYLNNMLQNNQYMVTTQRLVEGDDFQYSYYSLGVNNTNLGTASNKIYYSENATIGQRLKDVSAKAHDGFETWGTEDHYEYSTDLAMNFDKIYSVNDSDAASEALTEYEYKKALIKAKESKIDTRMQNLETEQAAISERKKALESMLKENIERLNIFTA